MLTRPIPDPASKKHGKAAALGQELRRERERETQTDTERERQSERESEIASSKVMVLPALMTLSFDLNLGADPSR